MAWLASKCKFWQNSQEQMLNNSHKWWSLKSDNLQVMTNYGLKFSILLNLLHVSVQMALLMNFWYVMVKTFLQFYDFLLESTELHDLNF